MGIKLEFKTRNSNNFKNYPIGFGTESRLYRTWANIKSRCSNKKNHFYHFYGGRGIKICSDWMKYTPFLKWSLENGYTNFLTIDRVDNNKGYSPENCRWADRYTQGNNRRNVNRYTYEGITDTFTGFAKRLGVKQSTLEQRFYVYKWPIEKVLSLPIGKRTVCR